MYSTIDTREATPVSGLRRLARRDLPPTARVAPAAPAAVPTMVAEPAVQPVWPALTLMAALRWVRTGWKWIAVLAVAGIVLGLGYAQIATPKFTATADLVVDPGNLQVVNNDLYPSTLDQNAQLLDVESKLRVLTSGNVLRRVVDQLQLQNDPEFAGGKGLELPFIGGGAPADGDPAVTAVNALEKKVSAWREERSFVVTLSVSTEDADKSVRIANAIVDAFGTELAQADADGAARAASSLMDRLSGLKDEVTAAEVAVETFKTANGLEESTNGELVNAQSMALLNTRAVDAQQALITAQSHYAALTDPKTGRANADAVQTATMVALRTQYGTLKQQADADATMYGPLHPTRASADRQLAGLQQQIAAEAQRAVQTARLDLDQAQRNVAELDAQTKAARNTVASDGQAQVKLNELERDAKAKSDVYEAFLTRAREITARQELNTTNIRVISPPTPPSVRSWPPRGVVTAGIGGVAGTVLGLALALGLGFLAAFRRANRA